MMTRQIKKILIVGGGTAGWMSAAYLNRALGRSVQITLIESSEVVPIGVGEATIPTFGTTMEFLGFQDADWMPAIGATYKSAIRFVDWNVSAPGEPSADYWHPFGLRPEPHVLPYGAPFFPPNGESFSVLHYALKRRLDGDTTQLAAMIDSAPAMCIEQRSPKLSEDSELNIRTAYHVDAGLLSKFLRTAAKERGVKHIVDNVVDVERNASGGIDAVIRKSGQRVIADLFLDCSGFRSILMNQALEEPFLDESGTLLCNAAVAMPCDGNAENDLPPFTTSTALRNGWVWDVPLFHRHGCGYVYSSGHTSESEAEAELRRFLGPRCHNSTAKHIRMRVGRSRRWWKHNCVAVGLSGGFLEPLESTGILFIEFGLAALVSMFPDEQCHRARQSFYNETMTEMYEEIRDFLVLHYYLNARQDSDFWHDARAKSTLPDSLKTKLEFFTQSLPLLDGYRFTIFRAFSYSCILDGNNRLPDHPHPVLEHIGYELGDQLIANIQSQTKERLAKMPSHYEYLKAMGHGR